MIVVERLVLENDPINRSYDSRNGFRFAAINYGVNLGLVVIATSETCTISLGFNGVLDYISRNRQVQLALRTDTLELFNEPWRGKAQLPESQNSRTRIQTLFYTT